MLRATPTPTASTADSASTSKRSSNPASRPKRKRLPQSRGAFSSFGGARCGAGVPSGNWKSSSRESRPLDVPSLPPERRSVRSLRNTGMTIFAREQLRRRRLRTRESTDHPRDHLRMLVSLMWPPASPRRHRPRGRRDRCGRRRGEFRWICLAENRRIRRFGSRRRRGLGRGRR